MKHLKYLLMAALVAMPLTACDEDDDPVVEPTPTGTVTGTVSAEGTGLAGVSVTLVGAVSQSATTGANGAYTFTDVPAGSYGVSIDASTHPEVSFAQTSKVTSITTMGQTATVDFTGTYIRTASITTMVTADGQPVGGVSVAVTGGPDAPKSCVTGMGGDCSVTGLRAGTYTVTISNTPEGYTFTTMTQNVTVATGESKTALFPGQRPDDPVTATILIKSVTQFGTLWPVDPDNVQGQIDVTIQVDPGQNQLTGIQLFLDDILVGSQTIGVGVAGEDVELAAAPMEVVFSVNTAKFDAETGEVSFLNKAWALSAKLGLKDAEEPSVTTSMELVFRNADRWVVTMTNVGATANSATAADGRPWKRGDVQVTAYPVMYSGRTVTFATLSLHEDVVGFPGVAGMVGNFWTREGEPPFVATWTNTTTGARRVNNIEPGAIIGVVSSSVLSDGSDGPNSIPAAPGNTTEPFGMRLDNKAPDLTGVMLDPPASLWFGANDVFSQTVNYVDGTPTDGGVGLIRYEWQYSENPGAATPTWVTFDSTTDLPETSTNTVLGFRVRVFDGLGNVAILSDAALRVGADRVPPVMTLQTAPPNYSANSTTEYSFLLSDDASGFGAEPLQYRIVLTRFTAGGATQNRCVLTDGTESVPPAAGCGWVERAATSFPIPPNDGYQEVDIRARDLARNIGETDSRLLLWDVTLPTITFGPVTIDGNTRIVNAVARDNVDLRATDHRVDFSGLIAPVTPLDVFGSFGLEDRVFSRDLNFTLALWRGIQGTTSAGVPDGGALLPLTGLGFGAQDVARNFDYAIYPATHTDAPQTFTTGVSATQVDSFRVSIPAAAQAICNGGAGCATGVPNVRTLRATASGEPSVFTNPFALVLFYRVDPTGVLYLIGATSAFQQEEIQVGGVDTRRDFHYTIQFDATGIPAQANVDIVAVGYSSALNTGLVSPENANISIQGTLALPWP